MATTNFVDGVTLSAAAWANDIDTSAYAALTGVGGTANAITATGPANYTHAAGRFIRFLPASTNTGSTAIVITPSGGSALASRNIFWNGVACVGDEIRANIPCVLYDDGTQLNIVGNGFNAATLDTHPLVEGGTDRTKKVRFEVDGLTTATTRVITAPDSNITLPIMTQALTFAGPTAARTYSLPDASISILNSNYIHVISGPTAARTFTFPDADTTVAGTTTVQTLTNKIVSVVAGTGTGTGFVAGIINQDSASGSGSPADTNENDLKSYTVPANTLVTNGDILRFTCVYRCAANATTKRIRVKFGATTLIDSTAIALNGADVVIEGWIMRTGATSQSVHTRATQSADGQVWSTALGGAVGFAAPSETLSGAITFKTTVTLGAGAALNDVIQDAFIVEYLRKA